MLSSRWGNRWVCASLCILKEVDDAWSGFAAVADMDSDIDKCVSD